jgi:hypothetical protein
VALEHHLEGDDQQQQPAGDAECRHADAKRREPALADNGEQQQHGAADGRALERHRAAPRPLDAAREADEDRQQPDRVDGDEERGEREDQGLAHGWPAAQ